MIFTHTSTRNLTFTHKVRIQGNRLFWKVRIQRTHASCFRKYEYTRETLLKFKEELEERQKAGNKQPGGQGGFGGGGGGGAGFTGPSATAGHLDKVSQCGVAFCPFAIPN